jgi:hypothetical protein
LTVSSTGRPDDVVVGQDQAVGVEDDAGAGRRARTGLAVVGSVEVMPSATIVTTAGLTALTMSTVAWLPAALPVGWHSGRRRLGGAVAGRRRPGVCAVALTSAYVPPDAISEDARATPTTNAGPTVRFDLDDRLAVDAGGGERLLGSGRLG